MAKKQETYVETPFYGYLWDFYKNHKIVVLCLV